MRQWPLRRKIVAFVLAIMITFLVARGVARAAQAYDVYLGFVVNEARATAEALAVAVGQEGWDDSGRVEDLLLAVQTRVGRIESAGPAILVTDENHNVVAATDPGLRNSALGESSRRALSGVTDPGAVATFRVQSESDSTNWVAVPIETEGERMGSVAIQYSRDPVSAWMTASVAYELLTIVVLTMGLVLILLVGLRKMVLKPLAALEAGAARFGEGDLDARINLETGDELEAVADALNRMAGALKAYQAKRIAQEKQAALVEVACATADELSQPLTVVIGYADLLREQGVDTPGFLEEAAESIQRSGHKMAAVVRELSRTTDDSAGGVGASTPSPLSTSASDPMSRSGCEH